MKRLISLILALILLFSFTGCNIELRHEHQEQIIASLGATCKETGLTEGVVCAKCGEVLRAQEVIPKTDHHLSSWTYTLEPSCTENGERARSCLSCGDYVEREKVDASGHSYEIKNNILVCSRCGDIKTSSDAAKENKVNVVGPSVFYGIPRLYELYGIDSSYMDHEIGILTTGYSTMEVNQYGEYVWNQTAVKSYNKSTDPMGDLIVTIEINQGLKFSDGSDIKAENYIAALLAYNSPVAQAIDGLQYANGHTIKGYNEFSLYKGANEYVSGAKKEFAGVRLLGNYKFSISITKEYAGYYFAEVYSKITPYPLDFVLGDDVSIKDEGNGAYLTDSWYKKSGGSYVKTAHISSASRDIYSYPWSGAYVIKSYNSSKGELTLEINTEFKGNFEGQLPSIKTIVYKEPVNDELSKLLSGEIDVSTGYLGAEEINMAMLAVLQGEGLLKADYYTRAGYGKIQFSCDFSPTMFKSVRHAIAYLIDTDSFSYEFTGGFGSVVYGPYSPDFAMYRDVGSSLELEEYTHSVEKAKQALIDDGWIYNSKGGTFAPGMGGADAVRYKKLTGNEITEANINFKSVSNKDGVVYKTVNVNGNYYMPCVINWFGTQPNSVTDMIEERLVGSADAASIGMAIRLTTGDFDRLLDIIYRTDNDMTYSMFNLATSWTSSIYDHSWNWTLDPNYFSSYSTNFLRDEYDIAFPYYDSKGNHTEFSFEEALKASGGRLGLDYLSMAMVYDAENRIEYNKWWAAYIERWNELLPDIPLYSNYIFDIYNSKLENFMTGPFWSQANALLYANVNINYGD